MTTISNADGARRRPGIAVIATCFNRREVTLAGLRALPAAFGDLDYAVYLVDDGCTDGTSDAVRAEFPDVRIIEGDGSLFWNGGMRKAWEMARLDSPEYYMWWNDDLKLLAGSIVKLFAHQRDSENKFGGKVILVGKVVDPITEVVTYGAYNRGSRISKLSFKRALDGNENCVTMNGNCVLLPAKITEDVGILSDRYRHCTGDVDFGLRAKKSGYHIIQSLVTVGFGAANKTLYSDRDAKVSLAKAKFVFTNPKGVPLEEWSYFCRSHGGWIWPVNFVYRYLRIFGIAG